MGHIFDKFYKISDVHKAESSNQLTNLFAIIMLLFLQLEIQPRVVNARDYELLNWEHEQVALCVFSTSGDGNQATA